MEFSLLERFHGDGEASTVRCDLQRVVRILAIEKGSSGDRAFADAFAAWEKE